MDVSVIIVSFNTRDLTLQCIESIIRLTEHLNYEIIVVDNSSVDGSPEAVPERYPLVTMIESAGNIGFGQANNSGAAVARGKYLFFLNSDTILLNNSIWHLFQFNQEKSTQLAIGASGGILIDESKMETGSFGPIPGKRDILISMLGLAPRFTKMTSKEKTHFQENGYIEVGYITGADLFITKSLFDLTGGFDPEIFMYYEETDLQIRLQEAGYKNYVIDGTSIIHLEGSSLNQLKSNNKKRLIVTKSMFYFLRKHSNPITFFLFKILFLSIRLTTVFYFSYSWKEKKEYIMQIIKS